MTYLAHEPSNAACPCWGCENKRRLVEYRARRRQERERAAVETRDLVVRHVSKPLPPSREDIYEFAHGMRVARGLLRELLVDNRIGYARELAELFEQLDMGQRMLVLERARRDGEVVVGKMDLFAEETP